MKTVRIVAYGVGLYEHAVRTGKEHSREGVLYTGSKPKCGQYYRNLLAMQRASRTRELQTRQETARKRTRAPEDGWQEGPQEEGAAEESVITRGGGTALFTV